MLCPESHIAFNDQGIEERVEKPGFLGMAAYY